MMQRAKGMMGWRQENGHNTLADEDDHETHFRASNSGWPPAAQASGGSRPSTSQTANAPRPAAGNTPWDQAASIKAQLEAELRREGKSSVGSPSATSATPRRSRSQSNLDLPTSGSSRDLTSAASGAFPGDVTGTPSAGGGGGGSSARERSEKRRSRRRSRAGTGEDGADDPFMGFDGLSSGAPTPNPSSATPWGQLQPPLPIPVSPQQPSASPISQSAMPGPQGGPLGQAWPGGSPQSPQGGQWGGSPQQQTAQVGGGSPSQPFLAPPSQQMDASRSAPTPARPVPTSTVPTTPGMFDDAILAALSALPPASLVDVLRRLAQVRGADVTQALGTLGARAPSAAGSSEAGSPSKYSQGPPPPPLASSPVAEAATPIQSAGLSDVFPSATWNEAQPAVPDASVQPETTMPPQQDSAPQIQALNQPQAQVPPPTSPTNMQQQQQQQQQQQASPSQMPTSLSAAAAEAAAAEMQQQLQQQQQQQELQQMQQMQQQQQQQQQSSPMSPMPQAAQPQPVPVEVPAAPIPQPQTQQPQQQLLQVPPQAGQPAHQMGSPNVSAATPAWSDPNQTPQQQAATAWPTAGHWPVQSGSPSMPAQTAPTGPNPGLSPAAQAANAAPSSPAPGWGWPAPAQGGGGSPGNMVAAAVAEAAAAASAPAVQSSSWPEQPGGSAAWPSGGWPAPASNGAQAPQSGNWP